MVYMPSVRPTLTHDIKRLEAEFIHGYQPGAPVFYVSLTYALFVVVCSSSMIGTIASRHG
jgi:hypothetical protein